MRRRRMEWNGRNIIFFFKRKGMSMYVF